MTGPWLTHTLEGRRDVTMQLIIPDVSHSWLKNQMLMRPCAQWSWAGTSAAQRLQRGEKNVKSPFLAFVLTPVLSWGLTLLCCLRNLDFKALSLSVSAKSYSCRQSWDSKILPLRLIILMKFWDPRWSLWVLRVLSFGGSTVLSFSW